MDLEGPSPKSNLAWKQAPHLASMPTSYFPCPSSYPYLGLGSPFHVMSLGPRCCFADKQSMS